MEATEFMIGRLARLTSVLDTDERPNTNYNSARTSIKTHSLISRKGFLTDFDDNLFACTCE